MSDQGHDPGDFVLREQQEVADEAVRALFGVEPVEDRSGLFTGKPAPTPRELDEEALFQAHMRGFPGQHQ
jgi:hypothetical protein